MTRDEYVREDRAAYRVEDEDEDEQEQEKDAI
jgi:hypothetical protein